MYTDVHSWAGMSVVPRSSDVFAQQKLDVEKCTRRYKKRLDAFILTI